MFMFVLMLVFMSFTFVVVVIAGIVTGGQKRHRKGQHNGQDSMFHGMMM